MDEDRTGRHADRNGARAAAPVSRRWFLLGGGVLVLAGGGAGVAVRLARDDNADTTVPDPPPAALLAAAAREKALIADLDATTGGGPQVRAAITRTRADHAAHLQAMESLLAGYRTVTPTGSSSVQTGTVPTSNGPTGTVPSSTVATGSTVPLDRNSAAPVTGTPRTRAQLRAAETRASNAAASAAALLDGRAATLLASIAACEATHAVVLA